MNRRALNDTLEASRRFRVFLVVDDEVRQVFVKIALEVVGQFVDIDATLSDRDRDAPLLADIAVTDLF